MHAPRGQEVAQPGQRGRTDDDRISRQRAELLDVGPSVLLSPRRITSALGIVVFLLVSAHIVLMALYSVAPPTDETRLSPLRFLSTLFDLNAEANPPTWYSSFMLLVSSGLLSLIVLDKIRKRDLYARHWAVLAIGFLYLSIDEGSRLHDRLVAPLRSELNLSGPFYYSWVILAVPALLIIGVWYLRFFLHLPRRSQLLFAFAAATYIGGAVGVEVATGLYEQFRGSVGRADLVFELLVALEEGGEMVGVLIFIYALMSYLRSNIGAVHLRFNDERVR